MTEADIIEQIIALMDVLMTGVSVYFTIVSAYIVALWAFLGRAAFVLKLFSFAFFTAAHGFIVSFFLGMRGQQVGLVEALRELDAQGELSAAGRAAIDNASRGVDEQIAVVMWAVAAGFYIAAFALTFFNRSTMSNQD